MNSLNILVAGPAGTGLESIAHSLALSFTREGLFVHTTSEYENRIRGGHNYSYIRIADEKITSHSEEFDLVIAMDKRSVIEHLSKVKEGGFVLFDEGVDFQEYKNLAKEKSVELLPIPALKLATEAGLKLTANVVAVGAVFALLDRSVETFKTVLETIFKRKGDEIVQINFKALELGFEFIKNEIEYRKPFDVEGDKKKRFLMNGNEAIALGCIKGGLKYLAAYPMTPGSTIMTTLAKESKKYDVLVTHVEDEIAAVNMAIGAGYAGVRAGTSTSGGGFALMGEAVSLAGMIEAPVIIFDAQRPGPSTGLSTKTGQGDLRMAMHCGQGDFPRLVIAAGNHEDCVELTGEALNLAEEYQLPVIFLTEKYVADSFQTCESGIAEDIKIRRGKRANSSEIENAHKNIDGRFPRYSISEDGISPHVFPGMVGGEYVANSYEHDEYGLATDDTDTVIKMNEKRAKKMKELEKNLSDPKVFGEESTKVFFVWGATIGPALEAQKLLQAKGEDIQVIQMQYILPFKKDAVKKLLENKKLICIEGNQSGQLESILKENTGIIPAHSIRKFDGEPISGEWIVEEYKKI